MAETTGQQPLLAGEDAFDLRQIVRTLLRRWQLVLGVPMVTFLFTLGYLRAAPRVYEASSIIRVQQDVSTSSPVLPLLNLRQSPSQIDLKTVERLVTTRLTAQEAIRFLRGKNLKAFERLVHANTTVNFDFSKSQDKTSNRPALDELLIGRVLKMVRTKAVEPDLVEIRVRHTDPELAMLLANSLAEAMVHRFTTEAQRDASQERRYIERSLKTLEQQLRDLEAQIAREKKRLGIVDIPKETEALLTALRTYELEFHNAQAQRDTAAKELARIQTLLAKEQPIVSVDVLKEDPLFKQTREQLAQLELERARLLTLFTPEHPEVQQLEERINTLRESFAKQARQLVREREVAPNPAYQLLYQQLMAAEANRFAAEARLQALNRFLPELRRRLEELPENQRRLGALLRKAQATEQVYTNLLMRLEEARIREATQVGNLTIADVATLPQEPVSPRPLLTLALALMLGIFLGVIAALAWEGFRETVASADEVQERLGIPVLASVPKTRSDLTHEHILDLMASRRAAAESLHSLRANLKFLSRQKPLQVLLITSTAPEEGKTFVACGLAIAWAQAGHLTILVDFDLRRPQVHEWLQVPNEKGLTNLLAQTAELDEVLQPTPLRNLQVITSGPLPPNPTELLDSERVGQILGELRKRAEVIILDTPPALAVSDTALLIPHADGVLIVVVPDQTLRPMLRQLKEQVVLAQGQLIGAVVNKITPAQGSYYRYYHRYYGEP
ncbi:MAG: hypothetical protein IMHGJWDQ_000479 [Candidatus Fervidibacter sp.]